MQNDIWNILLYDAYSMKRKSPLHITVSNFVVVDFYMQQMNIKTD